MDRKNEIKEMKAKLEQYQSDFTNAQLANEELNNELNLARRKVNELDRSIQQTQTKIRETSRGQGITSLQLQELSNEQRLYERNLDISNLVEEHPSFLDVVEIQLKEMEIEQDEGKILPLELVIDTGIFKEKLTELNNIDYIKTYGRNKASLTYSNYEEAYDKKIKNLVEGHLDGLPSQLFSYEDFSPIAKEFLKSPSIKEFLGS